MALISNPMMLYVLDEHGQPVPEPDALAWGAWMEARRVDGTLHVSEDYDEGDADGKIRISTVFLGIDNGWGLRDVPVLWETMVFGGPLDGEQDRYTSLLDAIAGHQAMCQRVTAMLNQ